MSKQHVSINLNVNLGQILPGGDGSSEKGSGENIEHKKVPILALSPPAKAVVPSKARSSPRKVFIKECNEMCKYKLSDESGEAKVAISKLKGKAPLQSRTPREQRKSPTGVSPRIPHTGGDHDSATKFDSKVTEVSKTVKRFSFDIQTEEKLSRTEPLKMWGSFDENEAFQGKRYIPLSKDTSAVASNDDARAEEKGGESLGTMKFIKDLETGTGIDVSTSKGGDDKSERNGGPSLKGREIVKSVDYALGLPEMDPAVLGTSNDSPVVYKGWHNMSVSQQQGIQGYGRALVLKSYGTKEFDFGSALGSTEKVSRSPRALAESDIEYVKSSAAIDRQPQQYKGKATRELTQTQVQLKTGDGSTVQTPHGLRGNKLRPPPSDAYGTTAALMKPASPASAGHIASPRALLGRGELQLRVSGAGRKETATHAREGGEGYQEGAPLDEVELGRSMASRNGASPAEAMMDRGQGLGEAGMSPSEIHAQDLPGMGTEAEDATAKKSSFFKAILRADRQGTMDPERFVDIHYPDLAPASPETRAVPNPNPGFARDPPVETLANPGVVSPTTYRTVLKKTEGLVQPGQEQTSRRGTDVSTQEAMSVPVPRLDPALEAPPAPSTASPAVAVPILSRDQGQGGDSMSVDAEEEDVGPAEEAKGGESSQLHVPFAPAPPSVSRTPVHTSTAAESVLPVVVPAPGVIVKKLVQAVATFVADGAVASTLLNFISHQQGEEHKGLTTEQEAQLTELEKREYQSFPSATRCFYGLLEAKMRTERFVGHNNYGYDDAEGNYQVKAGDHLAYRLEVRDLLGWGSFGAVYKCWDHYKKRNCAVKICRNKPSISQHVDSELETLLLLRSQAKDLSRRMSIMSLSKESKANAMDTTGTMSLLGAVTGRAAEAETPVVEFGQAHNCVTIQESFVFRHHRCLVFQSFGINLYEYLKSGKFQGMGLGQVRKVALQLLKALKHLKGLGIVHCDVKPENVLLKGDPRGGCGDESVMEVVLCDFGSASYIGTHFPAYVQSRYYRAPEVVLRLRSNQRDHQDASSPTMDMPMPAYGFEVDMWSLAAMLPELRTGNVCFPAESEHDLFACYCEVLGMPPPSLIGRVDPSLVEALVEKDEDTGEHTLKSALLVSPLGKTRTIGSRSIARIARARKTDASFVDFLARCLAWDPQERLDVESAASHDWITKINLHQHRAPGLAARRSPVVDETPIPGINNICEE